MQDFFINIFRVFSVRLSHTQSQNIMKIGIDARFYSSAFTGIGRYSYELITHLAEIDLENHYVVFLNNPQYAEFTPPNERWRKVLADTPHYSLKEQFHFKKVIEKENVDLMHFTHFNAPILYRGKSVVTIHDLTLTLYPGAKMRSPLRRFAYHQTISSIARRSKKIIAVSHKTKDDIVHFLKVNPHKIDVIYEASNETFRVLPSEYMAAKSLELKEKYGIEQPYLLYTGVWRDHKNLVNLLRAFSILKNNHGFSGKLVITGKEDPHYPEVKKTAHELVLSNDVIFTGLVPEDHLITLVNGATAYVMPSFYEGFGLPILEAFACGTPVACSRSSCLPEIAGEGNAVFFDPHCPMEIADALQKIITDETLRETLRTRGLNRAQEFSWRKTAQETLAVYQESMRI